MEEKEISLQQALEAEQYVRSYIESVGGDVANVMAQPNFTKYFPDDVKRAWETSQKYWNSQPEGLIV